MIRSLLKARSLLDALAGDSSELGLSELAAASGLHPTTARRLLRTLEHIGFVAQDPVTRRYRLGIGLYQLGQRVAARLDVRRIARLHLERLRDLADEASYLAAYDRGFVVYLDRVDAPHMIQLVSEVGGRLPAHATATGRAILAHMREDELEDLLKSLRNAANAGELDLDQVRVELQRVRELGYAMTWGEPTADTFSVAAPIYGPTGTVNFAVAISGPAYRVDKNVVSTQFADAVKEAARQISMELGARTP